MSKDTPQQASSLRLYSCACGSFHIRLFDRDDSCFAEVVMSRNVAIDFAEDLVTGIEKTADQGLSVMTCEGSA